MNLRILEDGTFLALLLGQILQHLQSASQASQVASNGNIFNIARQLARPNGQLPVPNGGLAGL